MVPQLVWFKRDLRVADHRPLHEAIQRGPALCLYIHEPELLQAPDADAAHLEFVNQSLADLRESLRRLGGELLIKCGDAVSVQIREIWAREETTNDRAYRIKPVIKLPANGSVRSNEQWPQKPLQRRFWRNTAVAASQSFEKSSRLSG